MCDHPNREAAMVTIERDEHGTPTVFCDPCLEQLIRALNNGGLRTIASCCGHGRLPGSVILADGRELLLVEGFEGTAITEFVYANRTINDPQETHE